LLLRKKSLLGARPRQAWKMAIEMAESGIPGMSRRATGVKAARIAASVDAIA
jgi:hypothetical protein